jgi:hypothetical protein
MSSWYDLCPDGTVRPHGGASGPCALSTVGTSVGTATTGLAIRGWEFNVSTRLWTATKNVLSGTYYAHHANIDVGTGNAVVPRITLVASSEQLANCSAKRYGNITWDHYDMGAPAFRNLWMYADADIETQANFVAGRGWDFPPIVSGMFVAGDQIKMQTSAAGAVGSVLVADQCASPSPLPGGLVTTSEISNLEIYYDPDSDAPFTSIITTSLWLDYSG